VVASADADLPSEHDPDLHGELDGVLQRAPARDPEDRYPAVLELRRAFERCFIAERVGAALAAIEYWPSKGRPGHRAALAIVAARTPYSVPGVPVDGVELEQKLLISGSDRSHLHGISLSEHDLSDGACIPPNRRPVFRGGRTERGIVGLEDIHRSVGALLPLSYRRHFSSPTTPREFSNPCSTCISIAALRLIPSRFVSPSMSSTSPQAFAECAVLVPRLPPRLLQDDRHVFAPGRGARRGLNRHAVAVNSIR